MFSRMSDRPSTPAFPLKYPRWHYAALGFIILVGLGLRFWQLAAKPLWLDEVIAALFVLGRQLQDVPLNTAFPLSDLANLFAYRPQVSCAQIAQTVATQSVHPPLFFCGLYRWMGWLTPLTDNWVWALRSLPALLGVAMIPALYWLGRRAISPRVGLVSAALVSVSPFAVYLSQEARHYTLPMLLTTLSLIALVQLQQDMAGGRSLCRWALGIWVSLNILGLYVHYFFLLILIAQVVALGGWLVGRSRQTPGLLRRYGLTLTLAVVVVGVAYLPWLPTLLGHFGRPETDWLEPYKPDWRDRVAPAYQLVMGWVLMAIALPVENQPWAIAVPAAVMMLIFGVWIGWRVGRGLATQWQQTAAADSLMLIGGVVLTVILEFLGIVYLLNKDVTAVPRYNFVYYPGMVILLGTGLSAVGQVSRGEAMPFPRNLFRSPPVVATLLVGLLSSVLVVQGIVFQKGYYPHRVAQDMAFEPETPVMVAVSYQSLQEVALGLSFALELQKIERQRGNAPTSPPSANFVFIRREGGFNQVWRDLAKTDHSLPLPLNLWAIASPGMKTKDYPPKLNLRRPGRRGRVACPIDPDRFNRIGFPYQLFRCDTSR
ncbi:MAG: glycosyltransferase family 39 protein [Synechococcales bacterium]|nr:glycosyltransferase family 39 protein [Synechococcales bacterium]